MSHPGKLAKIALLAAAVIIAWWLAMSPARPSQEPVAASGNVDVPPAAQPPSAEPAVNRDQAPEPDKPTLPATAEAPSGPSEAPAPTVRVNVPMRQGPVEQLSHRFASESRGPGSEQQDAHVRDAFTDPAIVPTLLHSVECRRSVCRAELRWAPQHDAGYVLGLTRALGSFSAPLAIEGAGAADAAGVRRLVVYFSLVR